MPGKEIKGRSKIATYRHGGRAGYNMGRIVTKPKKQKKIDEIFREGKGLKRLKSLGEK